MTTTSEAASKLQEEINNINQYLIEKEWHIIRYDFGISLTGYVHPKNKLKYPRSQSIVGICFFKSMGIDGSVESWLWEVKTHWTVWRKTFTEFEPAWKMFLQEEAKYHPNRIKWMDIDEQEIK